MQLYTDSWTVTSGLPDGQGLGISMIKKLVIRKFGGRYVDTPLSVGKRLEDIFCPGKCSSKGDLNRVFFFFNYQVD